MLRRVLAGALVVSSLWLAGACGGEDGGEVAGTGGIVGVGGASGSAGTAGAAASGGFINTDASADCPGGCDGGVCLNGSCCPIQSVCDTACCSAGDVCSFGKCETPGKECIDATECAPGEICDYSLGNPAPDGGTADAGADAGSCQGGATLRTGKCLPKPPECPTGVSPKPGEPITCLPVCEYKPAVGTFDPVPIAIGTPQENPVLLTQNDWRLLGEEGWNHNNLRGYWRLQAEQTGAYTATVRFRTDVPAGVVHLQVGEQRWVQRAAAG
ncbi:MAG TPA: hypothetical protein PKD61_23745, partial [Polyangiaceae bacterium]|nr:hypothetical protein [Polyangiaceae bacterium]